MKTENFPFLKRDHFDRRDFENYTTFIFNVFFYFILRLYLKNLDINNEILFKNEFWDEN